MSVNLTDPEVEAATASFYKNEKNWLVLAYSPQREKLVLYAAGSNGIAECERMLDAVGEEVAYALVRTTEEEGGGAGGKVAFVTYVGEGVGGVKRARATVHGRLVGNKLFTPHELAFTINVSSELPSSLQDELASSAPSPAQSNGDQTPRQPSPLNGATNGHLQQQQQQHQQREGSSSPQLPPPSTSSSSTQRPDLPHLHTLGPVQHDPSSHPHQLSSEPTPPLPSPLKELPPPPPFIPEPSLPSSSRRPSYPPPDEVHRNDSLPTSPRSTSSPVNRNITISPPPHSSSKHVEQTEAPSRSSNPISRLSSLSHSKPSSPTDSNFSGKSSSSMGRPSIPLFSSLSILSRKGKGRSVSAGSGPPPVPPKDGPKTPTSFSHFPIGTPQKALVEEPPVATIRGLDYSFNRDERPRVASTSSPPTSAHQHLPSASKPPIPSAIIVKSPTDRSLTNEDAYDDAYDAYDEQPGSPPRSKPSVIPSPAVLPRKLPSPPQFPKSLSPNTTTSSSLNSTAPLDLTKPRFPTILSQNYPTHRSASSPSQPLASHRTSSEASVAPSLQTLQHFRRASASKEFDGATPSGWLKEEQERRLDEDREQMNDRGAAQKKTAEREEKEGLERRRLKEEEKRKEDAKREEEKATRLRVARERTIALETKEKERKEEEAKKKERAELEKREKEEMEMARVRVELGKARIEGGRLADGWLTVQAPNSMLFRRRYFYILPSKLDLFKSPEEVSKPMTSIALPADIDITDAYEEIQVLHSFRVQSANGSTFLFYCDSEADKEVVVEALKVASKA